MTTTQRGLKAVAAVIEQHLEQDPVVGLRTLLDSIPAPVRERTPLRLRIASAVAPVVHGVGLFVCGGAVAGALTLVAG
jgi:hypothetical protein